jgi:hypothetical protein
MLFQIVGIHLSHQLRLTYLDLIDSFLKFGGPLIILALQILIFEFSPFQNRFEVSSNLRFKDGRFRFLRQRVELLVQSQMNRTMVECNMAGRRTYPQVFHQLEEA